MTSKLKLKDMLLWRRGFAFVSTGNERLWIHPGLRKIKFDQGMPPEISPMGMDGPDYPMFQSTSIAAAYEFCIQNNFMTALR